MLRYGLMRTTSLVLKEKKGALWSRLCVLGIYNGVDTFWSGMFGCVLKYLFEEDSATELFYRASSELLGEVVVGEEPVV